MAITFGVNIGLFGEMHMNNACPKKVSNLASSLKVDAALLGKTDGLPLPLKYLDVDLTRLSQLE